MNDIIRVCKLAKDYKMSVVFDLHTLMHDNSYTIPTWVSPRKFQTLFDDATVRQAWLNMWTYVMTQLSGIDNIMAWQIMNEPTIASWALSCTIDEFVKLCQDTKNIIRQYSSKPVSIRFAGDELIVAFKSDTRLITLCDFGSENWYEAYDTQTQLKNVLALWKGKQIMISEWGLNTDNDVTQLSKFKEYLNLFKSLNVTWSAVWLWRSDSNLANNPATIGKGYIIVKDTTGTPRPAFQAIVDSNLSSGIRSSGTILYQ